MNTVSRMERTGLHDMIQASQGTANPLLATGKSPRDEKVVAKGKDKMQTYWVMVGASKKKSTNGYTSIGGDEDE
jgi:hypothetical protein